MDEDRVILGEHFRVGPQLGDGGQARIYQVFDLETNSTVAVKLVGGKTGDRRGASSSLADQTYASIQRLRQEYHFLKSSAHPCLLAVHRLGESKLQGSHHYAWFTMELCASTVSKLLHEAQLPRRIQWALQLLDGLAFVHIQRISHRDIKPANLLVPDRNSDGIKIGDFGVASHYEALQIALRENPEQERTGTRCYMAPEVWAGPPTLWDERLFMGIDQYAAGISIHEMLTRTLPGKLADLQMADSVHAVHLRGIVDANFRLQIPERPGQRFLRVEQVLRRMLALRVDDRFASLSRCKLDLMCAMFNDGLLSA